MSIDPVGEEDVGIPSAAVVAVAAEDEASAVGAEHRKCIEALVAADFQQVAAVAIHRIQIERKASFVFMIGGEDDTPAVGHEGGCPVGLPQLGDLYGLATVSIGDKHFHAGRRHQVLCQQFFVFFDLSLGGRAGGTPDDLLAIGTEPSATIVTEGMGDAAGLAVLQVHDIEFEVTIACGGKEHFFAVGGESGFSVVAGGRGEFLYNIPVEVC